MYIVSQAYFGRTGFWKKPYSWNIASDHYTIFLSELPYSPWAAFLPWHLCIRSTFTSLHCINIFFPVCNVQIIVLQHQSHSILPKLFMRTYMHKQISPGLKFSSFIYLLHYPRLFIAYQLIFHAYLIFVEFLPRLHNNGTTCSGEWPSLAVISSLGHWNWFSSSWHVKSQSAPLAQPLPGVYGGIGNKLHECCSF